VRRVMVFFGGADADNLTGRVIAAFLSLKVESVVLEVVILPDRAHAASIRNQVFGYGRIILHERLASLARIQILWRQLAERHGLSISQWGLPSLAGFSFQSYNALAYKTLIKQEMLAKGFLAANASTILRKSSTVISKTWTPSSKLSANVIVEEGLQTF
jgi:hypothetical protein